MPELPEVETIKLGLEKYIVGKTIEKTEILLPRIFHGEAEQLKGAIVHAIRRFGKGLVIDLDNNYSIAAHVKMTGQLIYQGKETLQNFHPKLGVVGKLPNKWTHIIFYFSDKSTLFYNDIRQFGWLKLVETKNVKELSFFKSLGKEPFVDLDLTSFQEILRLSKAPIKSVLMDQRKIAGIGNIYASEALFLAKINPQRSAISLSKKEQERLYEAVLEVLRLGLKHNGASERNFIHVDGTQGSYQKHFLVYGRVGDPCSLCSTPLEKVVIAGRSSFFCPSCQI